MTPARIEQIARECGYCGIDDTFDIAKFARAIRNEALEEAARKVAPSEPRPCSCDVCDCGNSGDMRAVSYWDECNANAAAIRRLKETV